LAKNRVHWMDLPTVFSMFERVLSRPMFSRWLGVNGALALMRRWI